jgi:hypothetical protein
VSHQDDWHPFDLPIAVGRAVAYVAGFVAGAMDNEKGEGDELDGE